MGAFDSVGLGVGLSEKSVDRALLLGRARGWGKKERKESEGVGK
jgi:hypothetical protein